MKKALLTMALVAATTAAFAQGTINFNNTFLTAVKLVDQNVEPATTVSVPTTLNINYGVFWGTSSSDLALVPTLAVNSKTTAGLIDAGAGGGNFLIPGSESSGTVFMQIKGWSASFGADWLAASQTPGAIFGQTDIRQVTLGPTAGPGAAIWQGTTGTNPNRFNPLTLTASVVPEPGTFALAGLGAAALLIFRRRK